LRSIWPWKQILQFQWDRGSGFSSLNETEEADSAVSMRLLKPYQNLNIIFPPERVNFIFKLCLKSLASVVSMRLWKGIQLFRWDGVSGFSGLNETGDAASSVSLRHWKQIPRSQWDHGNRFWQLLSRLSWWIRSQMQNGFSPRVRALGRNVW
jgi:hypothetical protein